MATYSLSLSLSLLCTLSVLALKCHGPLLSLSWLLSLLDPLFSVLASYSLMAPYCLYHGSLLSLMAPYFLSLFLNPLYHGSLLSVMAFYSLSWLSTTLDRSPSWKYRCGNTTERCLIWVTGPWRPTEAHLIATIVGPWSCVVTEKVHWRGLGFSTSRWVTISPSQSSCPCLAGLVLICCARLTTKILLPDMSVKCLTLFVCLWNV